jgi:hypothetical protein
MSEALSALDRFRAMVMADRGLQRALARCDSAPAFVALAGEAAARGGLSLPAGLFDPALAPDPIQLFLFDPAPQGGAAWPGRDWRPIQIVHDGGGALAVDWAYFAGAALAAPFYAQDARRVAASPFNRLFRYRTGLDDFLRRAPQGLKPPDGLVFHMSRCGSTLVARMLAALPATDVVSEAPPLDMAATIAAGADRPGGTETDGADALLRAMAGALGGAAADRLLLKLDSWHAILLPLYRRAFPATPWLFLYRDPVEVLVSLMATPSAETTPDGRPPFFPGVESGPGVDRLDYCARVLALRCEAAIDALGKGGGLAVNYSRLPGAAPDILAHFGIEAGPAEQAAMAAAALRDAKAPERAFVADAAAKRQAASAEIRDAARRHLAAPYRALEALRAGGGR